MKKDTKIVSQERNGSRRNHRNPVELDLIFSNLVFPHLRICYTVRPLPLLLHHRRCDLPSPTRTSLANQASRVPYFFYVTSSRAHQSTQLLLTRLALAARLNLHASLLNNLSCWFKIE